MIKSSGRIPKVKEVVELGRDENKCPEGMKRSGGKNNKSRWIW